MKQLKLYRTMLRLGGYYSFLRNVRLSRVCCNKRGNALSRGVTEELIDAVVNLLITNTNNVDDYGYE